MLTVVPRTRPPRKKGLPEILNNIEDLNHILCADDITLWIAGGSDGHIQDTLQKAIDAVEAYVGSRGLGFCPQKSELLLYQPTSRGKRKTEVPDIQLFANQGQPIPLVTSIKILGMWIQNNGYNIETLRQLEATTYQTTRLVSRIANKHHGMKENSLIRLIQTFVLSRIVYVAPFLDLKTEEKKRINVMIRKTYKQALGIPVSTSNERFEAPGLHNTIEELIEAHRTAQMERLSKSQTGRHILEPLRINYEPRTDIKTDIPADIRRHIYIPPLPKHMHPSHNEERRKERAKALGRRFENSRKKV